MPEAMLEALLFGHQKGAFTGAAAANEGFFRAADGGTLLLDEIAEMPLQLQAKLLRVLQEGEVVPIGASRPIAINCRTVRTRGTSFMLLTGSQKDRPNDQGRPRHSAQAQSAAPC